MLLIRAGVEQNPGPGSGDRSRPKKKRMGRFKESGRRSKGTDENDSTSIADYMGTVKSPLRGPF